MAVKTGWPLSEIERLTNRDMVTLVNVLQERDQAAEEPERRKKRLEMHGLAG